jgi:hypothetical protein
MMATRFGSGSVSGQTTAPLGSMPRLHPPEGHAMLASLQFFETAALRFRYCDP